MLSTPYPQQCALTSAVPGPPYAGLLSDSLGVLAHRTSKYGLALGRLDACTPFRIRPIVIDSRQFGGQIINKIDGTTRRHLIGLWEEPGIDVPSSFQGT